MDPSKSKGAWIGIDLGTTNCTTSIWDRNQSSPKVLRLKGLSRPVDNVRGGKIVPSAVTFYVSDEKASKEKDVISEIEGLSSIAGYPALQYYGRKDFDRGSTITSFKRVVGLTTRQAMELHKSDPGFWTTLPFQHKIITDEQHLNQQINNDIRNCEATDSSGDILDILVGSSNVKPSPVQSTEIVEGVAIKLNPLSHNPLLSDDDYRSIDHQSHASERFISPLQVTAILLQSIRHEANAYLAKNRTLNAPSTRDQSDNTYGEENPIQNCIIGVPAHYSHTQRNAIQSAAKRAGFKGYVGVMTESTAAAMAYGLFVSANVQCNDKEKRILVFDMGGGTTDVTVAVMDSNATSSNNDESFSHGVKFRVVATAGDRCLGGDNVDELLARHLWKKLNLSDEWHISQHQEFILKCRVAKEQLCGNEKEDTPGLKETHFMFDGSKVDITRQEFDEAIQPLVDRAELVVRDALEQMTKSNISMPVHEVVLVGGSSHIPSIREMLRRKFPPPIPPSLCTSISAETAVAQGLAIQSALASGVVPLWELRNAMMLDALPHSIGVWVDPRIPKDGSGVPFQRGDIVHKDKSEGHFVGILEKDNPLPARGSATFTLANIDQYGVTVVAVEHIGQDTFQCMGTFTFLLHRIDLQKLSLGNGMNRRQIEVGMTLENDGRFIVSIFDNNDPEHREKKKLFLKQNGVEIEDIEYELETVRSSGIEASLMIMCAILFALYVATRIAFSDLELDLNGENDEL